MRPAAVQARAARAWPRPSVPTVLKPESKIRRWQSQVGWGRVPRLRRVRRLRPAWPREERRPNAAAEALIKAWSHSLVTSTRPCSPTPALGTTSHPSESEDASARPHSP